MKELVGEGHRQVLDMLCARLEAVVAGDGDLARVVILEGDSGIGKSRVVRELYRRLRAERDAEGYWPEIAESGGGDPRSRDPLPGRKCTGPDVNGFVWPAGVLPGFAWWQLHCEMMQAGQVMDVVSQARPEIEAHMVPVALGWRRAASYREKVAAKKDDVIVEARKALYDGGLEAAAQVLAGFDIVIPGLGTAASWVLRGGQAARQHRELRQDAMREVDLGQRAAGQRRSVSAELASLIAGVAHPKIPGVVVVEDLHLMDESLGDLLDRLAVPDPSHPVVVVAMAWPESRDRGAYAQWREQAIALGHAELAAMPYLGEEDLRRFVWTYAPNTSQAVADQAIRRYRNPLALEATLGSRIVVDAIAGHDGALPLEALSAHPVNLNEVYRERFRELSDEVQVALAVASGSLPDARSEQVWPFVRSIVVDAAQRCSTLPPSAADIMGGIDYAADGRVWLVSSGVAETFREAFQAQIAYEHLEQEVLLPQDRKALRESVVDVLVERIDTARSGGYLLDARQESVVISRWLLALATMTDHRQTQLAAAYCVAADLASTYQYKRAIDALTPWLDAESALHPHVLSFRDSIAHWLGEAGRVEDAITASQSLVADCQRVLGPDHPDTLAIRSHLAHWLGLAGRIEDAITASQSLVADCQRILGPDHPDTLTARNNFAHWRGKAGRVDDAVTRLEALLADYQRVMGPDHPDTLATRSTLARWLGGAGRVEDAITASQSLLADRQRVMGPDHADTLATCGNLANFLGDAGRFEEAITASQSLLADYQRVMGPDHPDTLATRGALAHWLGLAGRYDDAITGLQDLLDDRQRVLGPENPDTLTTRRNLANFLGLAGRVEEAITGLQDLLADCQRVLGPDHPDSLATRGALAILLHAAGRVDDAIVASLSLLVDRQRVLGPDHPDTLTTRSNLAYWLGEAGQLLQDRLADRLRVLGPDHPDTLITRGDLANFLGLTGRVDDAVAALQDLLADRLRVLGPDHPDTLITRNHVARWLGEGGPDRKDTLS